MVRRLIVSRCFLALFLSVCLSFTLLFSSHFYLYSDLNSFFHMDNAKANNPCVSANRGVLPSGRIHSSHTVGNGKLTGCVRKETMAVFRHDMNERAKSTTAESFSEIFFAAECEKMHREPEVLDAEAQVGEWLDCLARITSKELAPIHSVKNGILRKTCSTSPRMDVDLGKSALICTARLKNSLAKGLKRIMTKVQWLCWKFSRQWVAYFKIWSRRSLPSILRKSSNILKPIRCVRFTKAAFRHAIIRDQNPSLGMICPGDPHQRKPNPPKFEDRSQEETEWQKQGAREAAWRLAKNIFKIKREKYNSILVTFGKLVPACTINP